MTSSSSRCAQSAIVVPFKLVVVPFKLVVVPFKLVVVPSWAPGSRLNLSYKRGLEGRLF